MRFVTPEGNYTKMGLALGIVTVPILAFALLLVFRVAVLEYVQVLLDRTPRETPIEIAGNSAHICRPFKATDGIFIGNTSEAYLANPDGTNRSSNLIGRQWKSIRINFLGNDQSAIDIVAGVSSGQGVPVTITPHFAIKHSSDGLSDVSLCSGSTTECVQLGDIIFTDASGKMITMRSCESTPASGGAAVPGKCLLMLGQLKTVDKPYGCMNQ